MENEISTRRGLILLLVGTTVVIFIGAVWLIARTLPKDWLGGPNAGITAAPPQAQSNCTYPAWYWESHPEAYPSKLVLGGQVYHANDIGEVLRGADQTLAGQLKAQLLGVYLNISAGADEGLIEASIFQAYGWLMRHPEGNPVSDSERQAGSRLSSLLEAYNLGLAGAAACGDVPTRVPTGTATPTRTTSLTLTLTPTPTSTPTASSTPTSTLQPWTPQPTQVVPMKTPTATTAAPGGPPPTEQPPPTNTPKPPTQEPQPTNTPGLPTEPPEPSATSTEPPP